MGVANEVSIADAGFVYVTSSSNREQGPLTQVNTASQGRKHIDRDSHSAHIFLLTEFGHVH